jgi:carboxymethylenebutenolidase
MQRSTVRRIGIAAIAITFAWFAAVPAQAQQDTSWAKPRLANSPRHHELVKVKHGDRELECFIVYPEVKDKAQAVIVVHEIFGLTDWVQSVADQLAEAGYIAIAPDLLWGKGPNGEGTEALLKDGKQPTSVIGSLPPDQITADLNAVADYVTKLDSCNGKLSAAGFCWGGGEVFRYATNNKNLKAVYSFYGTPQKSEAEVAKINCPIYGFYGGMDNRIDSQVPAAVELMKKAGKIYEPVTYEGAGHGFMREGEIPNSTQPAAAHEANKKARDDAWVRWKDLLKKNS